MYSDPSQKLAVMSIGFLLGSRDDAVVWRGPKKNGIPYTVFVIAECSDNGASIQRSSSNTNNRTFRTQGPSSAVQ